MSHILMEASSMKLTQTDNTIEVLQNFMVGEKDICTE